MFFIHCLLLLSLGKKVNAGPLVCGLVLCILSVLVIILLRKRELVALILLCLCLSVFFDSFLRCGELDCVL